VNSQFGVGTKPLSFIVAGFSIAAAGLVVFLTVNGGASVSGAGFFALAGLITVGLLLPAGAMLWLGRIVDPIRRNARRGFVLLGLGMVGLFFGLLPVVAINSLSAYFVGSAILTVSGASALAGTALLGTSISGAGVRRTWDARLLLLAIVLIFTGVGLIVGSDIAHEYWITDLTNTVYVDVGATISACGAVVAANAFFTLRSG